MDPATLDRCFPRYTGFAPRVPVWRVTPRRPGCIHRFFDTCPISPSGRYLAVFQFPFEDRQPGPGEAGRVVLVDLETGADRVVAETRGWEPQMGANINWGASDHALFFNDVDTDSWTPFARRLDPLSGEAARLGGTVYHASPDGRWLVSADMTAMRRTQPGYGVRVPDGVMRRNVGLADDDGFTLTDTETGEARMLASIRDLVARADPPVRMDDPGAAEVYGFHCKFNPQGDRLMLSLRWFPAEEPRWNMFSVDHGAVRFAWVTTDLAAKSVRCAVGPEEWVKGGHHATWFPDGERISMNLNIDREGLRFVQVNADGTGLRKMRDDVTGSGHPTVHPDGKHILTDAYTHEGLAFGDGTTPLRWIDRATGAEETLVRFNTAQPAQDAALRVDPHPAWGREDRFVAFNAFLDGTRTVLLADLAAVIG